MQIIRKGTTPNGTDIRIEDWSETYPGTFKKNATIGFYPMAMFDFNTEEEAKEAFDSLQSGEKSFMDFLDNYSNFVISKANFIKAITA